jgi:hypothetical protein
MVARNVAPVFGQSRPSNDREAGPAAKSFKLATAPGR